MALTLTITQLAEILNNLSPSEKAELIEKLGKIKLQGENEIIQELLQKSIAQHNSGKARSSAEILRESKEKYGL